MISIIIQPTGAIALDLAARARALRLERGWTRDELARRAGVAPSTLKLFEQSGRVSLERLLKIAVALGAVQEFRDLFPLPAAQSLDEIERRLERPRRQRGRRRRRGQRDRSGPHGRSDPTGEHHRGARPVRTTDHAR